MSPARSVVTRALLALAAVIVIAWVGVLLRDYDLGHALFKRVTHPTGNRTARLSSPERLKQAELLNPESTWREARAGYYLFIGRSHTAERLADALVRDEPDNITAWSILRSATVRIDPHRSAQAVAQIRRLDPFSAR
jgi:hypothetical protein